MTGVAVGVCILAAWLGLLAIYLRRETTRLEAERDALESEARDRHPAGKAEPVVVEVTDAEFNEAVRRLVEGHGGAA